MKHLVHSQEPAYLPILEVPSEAAHGDGSRAESVDDLHVEFLIGHDEATLARGLFEARLDT